MKTKAVMALIFLGILAILWNVKTKLEFKKQENSFLCPKNVKNYKECALDKNKRQLIQIPSSKFLQNMKPKHWDNIIRSLKTFIHCYCRDPKHARQIMIAYGELMNIYEKQRKPWHFMEKEYKKIIHVFEQLSPKMQPVDITLTKHYPLKALFRLAMKLHEAFMKFQITTRNPKLQKKLMLKKLTDFKKVESAFLKITKYKSPSWLLCAMYRIAQAKQNVVQVIQNMPIPKIPGFQWTKEAKKVYKKKLEQAYIAPLREQAKALYQKVVERSQRLHFENECTNKAYKAIQVMNLNIPRSKTSHIQKKFLNTEQKIKK